ncbi:hypothetical protein H0H81_005493 [Sphagnurus paluster]|uniref:PDZ GRASP-type domain-containing protein n=1 Tax=Sphagnurus paluster TaxID=117069 RepID=A0A9P7GVN8_9AGAR|nr:hypothetical protein H0H81_005493 [Sphagnurus paluster]
MGASQSQSSSNQLPSRALHVLRVTPASPASRTNIEPFFDFVVGFEGNELSQENVIDASQLEKIVERHEGRVLNMLVWNSKSQKTRVVPIRPSRAWSQTDNDLAQQSNGYTPQPSLLGLSMRMCEPEHAAENVWHVLDVLEGSPAESAGLVPMGDWILGWSGGVLGAENDFYDLVEATSHSESTSIPMTLSKFWYFQSYVYCLTWSVMFSALREVVLIPNRHWGGEGLLGCVFGFGLLHRIPPQPEDRLPGATPIELQEAEQEYQEQELFVPADVHAESHFTPEQLEEWRRREDERWGEENALYEHSSTSHDIESYDDIHDHHDHHDHEHGHHGHSHDQYSARHETSYRTASIMDDARTPTRTSARPITGNS